MPQDLKSLFEDQRNQEFRMPADHESRFLDKLQAEFPEHRKPTGWWIGIAAAVIALLGFGFFGLYRSAPDVPAVENPVADRDSTAVETGITLGDLSPDLRKVEAYYTANINLELARLDISDTNRKVADDYMARLRDLDTEYSALSKELNEIGPNEETISAMIRNFQLRLQLLQQLKEKLNALNQSKNETVSSTQA